MATRRGLALLAALTLPALFAGAAQAQSFMQTGGRTTQPIGHYDFCRQMPAECEQTTPRQKPVELTKKLWGQIVEVNALVNTMITPRTDMQIWGVEERWSYPVNGIGDCEDYALEKRKRLMEIGVPAGNLLMTVLRQPNGDGHAVLTVRTSLGDFILDNLEPKVLAWNETPYEFLKMQSSTNSGVWVSIESDRNMLVGSVRK